MSSSSSLPSATTNLTEIKALEIFDGWKDPFTKYFEVTPCENWSPEHYVNWIIEYLEQKRVRRNFYRAVRAINNHEDISSRIKVVTNDLLENQKSTEEVWTNLPNTEKKRGRSEEDEVGTSKRRKVTDSERDQEVLSYIPPLIEFSPDASASKVTTSATGKPPKEVKLWEGFFEEVDGYTFDQEKREFDVPEFSYQRPFHKEKSVCTAFEVNVNTVLNEGELILVIEIKRSHILEDLGERTFPEYYADDEKGRAVVRQIYGYMARNNLAYGMLSTYDHFWFLYRPYEEPEQHISSPIFLPHDNNSTMCQNSNPPPFSQPQSVPNQHPTFHRN
ncbi:6504_t:CDS:2, partial [Scutellospora calospora]